MLGRGKRLFGDGAIPAAFRLTKSLASPSGVLIASYERAGAVTTGSFAMEQPTPAELERRRKLNRSDSWSVEIHRELTTVAAT